MFNTQCKDLLVDDGNRTYNNLDLIFGDDPGSDNNTRQKMPTLSERHKNRVQLKDKILKEMWGDETCMELKYTDLNIMIPEKVRGIMEERFILIEDIERVVDHGEKSKEGRCPLWMILHSKHSNCQLQGFVVHK